VVNVAYVCGCGCEWVCHARAFAPDAECRRPNDHWLSTASGWTVAFPTVPHLPTHLNIQAPVFYLRYIHNSSVGNGAQHKTLLLDAAAASSTGLSPPHPIPPASVVSHGVESPISSLVIMIKSLSAENQSPSILNVPEPSQNVRCYLQLHDGGGGLQYLYFFRHLC
jgi:hypothetical protein